LSFQRVSNITPVFYIGSTGGQGEHLRVDLAGPRALRWGGGARATPAGANRSGVKKFLRCF
jgi:hypothetical protein